MRKLIFPLSGKTKLSNINDDIDRAGETLDENIVPLPEPDTINHIWASVASSQQPADTQTNDIANKRLVYNNIIIINIPHADIDRLLSYTSYTRATDPFVAAAEQRRSGKLILPIYQTVRW